MRTKDNWLLKYLINMKLTRKLSFHCSDVTYTVESFPDVTLQSNVYVIRSEWHFNRLFNPFWSRLFQLNEFVMKFEISAVLKYGLYAAAILLSTELLCSWYVRQRNRISHRPVHEVYFMMSNQKYCCSYSNTKKYTKCPNSYCKAKLSHKLIEHINSAKHIICIAM